MTAKHVVSFSPDGVVEYTRNSKLTLFEGRGEMQRVTDIRKREDGNHYFIYWMLGPFAGTEHCHSYAWQYDIDTTGLASVGYTGLDTIYFPTYEAAVSHEVAMLNEMRKSGVSFGE